MALKLGSAATNVLSRWSNACRPVSVLPRLSSRGVSFMPQSVVAAAAAAGDAAAAAGDIADDFDWTEDMPVPVKRRVEALREVQGEYDAMMKGYIQERAELQAKYEKQAGPILGKRVAIVAGSEPVGKYDIEDDGSDEPDEGIPQFWLAALSNHDLIGEYITERDAEVLAHLGDVRVVTLTGEDAGGFKLEFEFGENPFFTNKVLEKTFYMEDPDDVIPDRFIGCSIDWAAGKNATVEQVKKKKKGKKGAPSVTVTKEQPCASFFNFFKTQEVPENPDDLKEEQLDALQQAMDEDYELGLAFRESLVPRAVQWFTGEIAGPMFDDEFEEGDEDEDFGGMPPLRR